MFNTKDCQFAEELDKMIRYTCFGISRNVCSTLAFCKIYPCWSTCGSTYVAFTLHCTINCLADAHGFDDTMLKDSICGLHSRMRMINLLEVLFHPFTTNTMNLIYPKSMPLEEKASARRILMLSINFGICFQMHI
jgi:hypothetical protein